MAYGYFKVITMNNDESRLNCQVSSTTLSKYTTCTCARLLGNIHCFRIAD
jgi:hypothetical protein